MLQDDQSFEPSTCDYPLLERQIVGLLEDERDFVANAANFSAFVFHHLPRVNWAGFYVPDKDGLLLGPFSGKPACARLPKGGGVCGTVFDRGETVIVPDVAAFPNHIACDTDSRSEMVLPLKSRGAVYGVFDIDSPVIGRFSKFDETGVARLLERFMQATDLPESYRTVAPKARMNESIDVQTARDHHSIIRYLLAEIDKEGASAAQFRALLGRLRNVLVAHLKLEDDWLYPKLAQSGNASLQKKLNDIAWRWAICAAVSSPCGRRGRERNSPANSSCNGVKPGMILPGGSKREWIRKMTICTQRRRKTLLADDGAVGGD